MVGQVGGRPDGVGCEIRHRPGHHIEACVGNQTYVYAPPPMRCTMPACDWDGSWTQSLAFAPGRGFD